MDHVTGFLREGFRLLEGWLMDTGDRGNLALGPETLSRTLYSRLMSRLRQAELILRQLVWALATTLQPNALSPRRPASRRTPAPQPYSWSFALVPTPSYSAAALDRFAERAASTPSKIRMRLLMARWHRLSALAADPARAARRMAGWIAARKTQGLYRPVAFPIKNTHRIPGELGLTASLVFRQANDALRASFDSS